MPRRKTFNDHLTDAINDIADHGYDSKKRLEDWLRVLKQSAEASMKTRRQMEDMLKTALRQIYKRMVEGGEILRYHPGVEPWRLERIKPQLRAELDRRIVASANLIKLNRDTAINQTLQRFSGWTTSIPKGGTDATKKRKTKEGIRRSLAGLPFRERRVLIDQGHKLTAAISDILAHDGGAIAGQWHSHWRQIGYNYRKDHKARDGRVYAIRGNWAMKAGYMKASQSGYLDQITQPGEEIFCRCYLSYIWNLRDLPAVMRTKKGSDKLREVRAQIARGDSMVAPAGVQPVQSQVI